MMRQLFRYLLAALALWGSSAAAAAQIDAWLDRTHINEGDTVQLTLEAKGREDGQPDTAPLENDFDVLGTSTGSRISIVNGRTDARTSWTLTLSPKHAGTLRIPALQVGGAKSPALSLEVGNAPAPAASSGADIFIETELEPHRPYVQQQVLYTVRLLHAVPVSDGRLSEPKPENTLVQPLGEDREYTTTRNGRHYEVVERRYALFPQGSGRLEVAAPVFDGEVPDARGRSANPLQQFFGNDPFFARSPFNNLLTPGRRTRVRGEAQTLEVQPRPAAAHASHWLPAKRLELDGAWQPDATGVPVGEPVTLALAMTAEGLTGGQLPNVAPVKVDGFDVYPDQVQRQTDSDEHGVTGHLQQNIAFIPRRAGKLALPEIRFNWWDTHAGRERVVTLPGRVLQVTPAVGGVTPPAVTAAPSPQAGNDAAARPAPPAGAGSPVAEPQPAPAGAHAWWPWVSAALAVFWAMTLLTWWWRSRAAHRIAHQAHHRAQQPLDTVSTGAARGRFLAACRAGDAPGARHALLEWAAGHWPGDPPRGLQALAQRLDDAGAREALTALDRALYKGDAWDGQTLAAYLQQLPQSAVPGERRERRLAPLYPESRRTCG